MKIYISQLIPNQEIQQLIKEYQVGVELIDFSIASNLDNPKATFDKFDEYNFNTNISIHGPFFDLMPASFDSMIKESTMKRFNQAYSLARLANAKHIIFHTGYLKNIYHYEGWLKNSITFWQEFLKDKDDINIYLENVFEDNYDHLLTLVKTINKENFNICLDIGHTNIQNPNEIKNIISKLSKYIKHLHIHNNNSIDDEHASIINGNIDYTKVFKLIKDFKINADMTLEMCNYQDLTDSLYWLKEHKII